MRYLVTNEKGYAVAVFMNEESAQAYIEYIYDTESNECELTEIKVENVHEFF